MMRLRWKLTALVLGVSMGCLVAASLVTTRLFVRDKRAYVLDLSSVIAPSISSSLASSLDGLDRELAHLHETYLRSPAGVAGMFRANPNFLQLDIFENGRPAATFVTPELKEKVAINLTSLEVKKRLLARSEHPRAFTYAVSFSTPNSLLTFVATLSKDLLRPHLQVGQALHTMLVTDSGEALLESAAPDQALELPVKWIRESIQNGDKQAVQIQEFEKNGAQILVAVSPLPRTHGAATVIVARNSEINQMAFQALRQMGPIVVITLLLVMVIGLMVSNRVAKPIEKLTAATLRMAEGHWNVNIQSNSTDEVGRLVRAFSKMGQELGRRERALKDTQEELIRSEKLATLGQFSAGIAHEVKNPLNSILGFTQILQMKYAKEPETMQSLNFIAEETRRTSRIIGDLLSFSRQRPPQFADCDLNDVVKHAMELIAPQARTHQVAVACELSSEKLNLNIDREQVYQVMLNLTVNAFHALEARKEGRQVTLRTRRDGEDFLIDIQDNGAGISEENVKKIFEPFFTTKTVGKGSGLGLSICYGIIKNHGGRIEVQSKLGEGTVFSLRLPRKAASINTAA